MSKKPEVNTSKEFGDAKSATSAVRKSVEVCSSGNQALDAFMKKALKKETPKKAS